MTNAIINKFSRLQGYPAGSIAPEVAELQSAINSMAQYDTSLSRSLNRAITNMVENSGSDESFNFYDEKMEDLIADGDDYFQIYMQRAESWIEYKEMAESGEIEATEPYEKIIKQIERVANLDI